MLGGGLAGTPDHPRAGGEHAASSQSCIKLSIGPPAVPAHSGHEGEKAPEGPTPKLIPIRCEPGRLAVRGA
jgi:hypothetical protein